MERAASAETSTIFESRRRALTRLAYRMLGSVAEAEDIVQEAWLRWHQTAQAQIANPAAFLTTIVTRLCLDHLKSARVQREHYVGAWLPEPLIDDQAANGEADAILADDLSVALMLTLERLTPLERAAFLLRDAFDLDFDSIGEVLGRSGATCRKLTERARAHIRETPRQARPSPQAADALTRAFMQASRSGDIEALQALLAHDAVLVSDGGGKRPAALLPLQGAEQIARMFAALLKKFQSPPLDGVDIIRINGLPGFVSRETDGLLQTTTLDIQDGRIRAIYIMRNPDKLKHLEGV